MRVPKKAKRRLQAKSVDEAIEQYSYLDGYYDEFIALAAGGGCQDSCSEKKEQEDLRVQITATFLRGCGHTTE